MKQYLIDGLRLEDCKKIKEYLNDNCEPSTIDGIFWLELDNELLNDIQRRHGECQPHVFALMLEESSLSCEFLVRIKKNIRCDCMDYANLDQRNWLIDTTDAILEKLDIRI
jgi:hypothetical protein